MFCRECGTEIPAYPCSSCEYRPPPSAAEPSAQDHGALAALVPIGRTGLSIGAGYLGLFSLICFIVGPVALVVGILAVREIRQNPEKQGMGRAIFGTVMGGITTLVTLAVVLVKVANL